MTEDKPTASGMKNCKYCGLEISKDTTFCWYCGRELEARPERPDFSETSRKSDRWPLIVLAVIAVVILLIIFVGQLFR